MVLLLPLGKLEYHLAEELDYIPKASRLYLNYLFKHSFFSMFDSLVVFMKSVVEIYLRSFVDLFLLSFCNTIRTFVVASAYLLLSFQVLTFILQRTFYLKKEPSQSDNFKKHLQQ